MSPPATRRARRWPRITLSGSVGPARQWSAGISTDGTVWSIGPIAVTVPIFDADVLRANAAAARARYDAARVAYAGSLRSAVPRMCAVDKSFQQAVRSKSIGAVQTR